MMTTTVVVNDFATHRRSVILLTREHFGKIIEVWQHEDSILAQMQDHGFFAGRHRWCDLDPSHFRLMVARNLTIAAQLPLIERDHSQHDVLRSLHFLLAALVYCLQQRSECLIELLRIARLSESEVTYDFTASLNMGDSRKPKNGLRVVVDNVS